MVLKGCDPAALAAGLCILCRRFQGDILIRVEQAVAEVVPLFADGDGLVIHFMQVGVSQYLYDFLSKFLYQIGIRSGKDIVDEFLGRIPGGRLLQVTMNLG
jgi:hypothetical protein